MLGNISRQNIATGFGFLHKEAAFGIGESLIAYSPADTYGRAFLVGLTNTLHVAALGIVFATILGTLMGLARLSSNWLVAKLAQVYVETFRNIPLLLQLFFWWGLLNKMAPAPREAWQILPDVFVSNRGITYPVPVASPAYQWVGWPLSGSLLTIGCRRWAARRQAATGRQFPTGWAGSGWSSGCRPRRSSRPARRWRSTCRSLKGFNFSGGEHDVAGIRRAADRAGDLHRHVYRRDRPRRHPRGELGPERGGDGARPAPRPADAARRAAAGACASSFRR
jgi:general L-amino acid transport system permease protein